MTDAADRHHRQLRAARALVDLVAQAALAGLPPLTWTVHTHHGLSARTPGYTPAAEQRATLAAWASHLGAVPAWEHESAEGGSRRVMTQAAVEREGHRIRITLIADLNLDENGEEE